MWNVDEEKKAAANEEEFDRSKIIEETPLPTLPTDNANKSIDKKFSNPTDYFNENPNMDMRNLRRIIAEDLSWNLKTIPTLEQLAIRSIIKDFEVTPMHDELPEKYQEMLAKELPATIPLDIVAPIISDESYWEKVCRHMWKTNDVFSHGLSWKRLCFEKRLVDLIENFVPQTTSLDEIQHHLSIGASYIRSLVIRQLLPPISTVPRLPDQDQFPKTSNLMDLQLKNEKLNEDDTMEEVTENCHHFDFDTILPLLPNLREFDVSYGVKNCGMNFEWNLFNFTKLDCSWLSKCLARTTHITVLRLENCRIDCDRSRVLIAAFVRYADSFVPNDEFSEDSNGIEEKEAEVNETHGTKLLTNRINRNFDCPIFQNCPNNLRLVSFAHNRIGDRGARAIGKFLSKSLYTPHLATLDLNNNRISSTGFGAISFGLTTNTVLESLNMTLNYIDDEGAQIIAKDLLANTTLTDLKLSGNRLTEPTAAAIANLLPHNKTLQHLDLSANRLGPDGGQQLQEAMLANKTLLTLDLRLTNCGQESEMIIHNILEKNRLNLKEDDFKETENIVIVKKMYINHLLK
ncbi:hypothetical protein SNEBB_005797 [Seison nebaliae]|nr:hypothetical protein SNEBB_005797 [Seison nebaliae]